jgi:hypothetical protein
LTKKSNSVNIAVKQATVAMPRTQYGISHLLSFLIRSERGAVEECHTQAGSLWPGDSDQNPACVVGVRLSSMYPLNVDHVNDFLTGVTRDS